MKESSFYSDDFEQLIREKTEQYKMYPSERVWKGVHNSLHTKRRWFIGSMSLLVTGILFFAGRELISPSVHAVVLLKPADITASLAESGKPWLAPHHLHNALSSSRNTNASVTAVRHSTASQDDPAGIQDTEYKELSITLAHPVIDPAGLSGWLDHVQMPDHAPEITVLAARSLAADGRMTDDILRPGARSGETASKETAETLRQLPDGADADGINAHDVLESLGAKAELARNSRMNGRLAKNNSNSGEISGGSPGSESSSHSAKASATAIAEARDRQRVNWLHDYALNSLPAPSNRGRTFFQLILAPTVNYRSVSGADPAWEKWGQPTGFAVSQKQLMNLSPAFGFEFGANILYRLTRNLSVKGGLQFNFARYKITAFATPNPSVPQGVDLNSYFGYLMDSVNRGNNPTQRASAANAGGSNVSVQTLNNDYYQVSAPIGFELRVLGNERLQFNLGATVQPSYLIGTTSYMLNNDMTKYGKDPDKYRKWNVSGGIEAFLSYRTGSIRWQVGPEFRYQFLSTYTSQYPITENLKTYGLKIGITRTLP